MNEFNLYPVNSNLDIVKREYNKHGTLVAEGKCVNGQPHGIWREYYDSGELAIMQTYVNGQPHGRFTSYHMNGNTWSEGTHHEGRCEGTFRVYDEDGNLVRVMVYAQGVLIEDRDISESSKTYFE
jgi:antitoxin component YwqK of YwqJK toxin-antitoxin module